MRNLRISIFIFAALSACAVSYCEEERTELDTIVVTPSRMEEKLGVRVVLDLRGR